VPEKVRRVTPYKYRHYFNYCFFSYTAPWWDWERWQWEIDFMALNGINMPLALTGQNIVWDKVYRSLGFTDKDMDGFFSGPAFFIWFWMGNLDGWGGPLPRSLMERNEALQKQILARERELGMTPILPSFTGHVPPSFGAHFPQAKVNTTQWGVNTNVAAPVYVLDPNEPMFAEIGERFLRELIDTYGTDHLYSADTFNEMMPPTNDSLYLHGIARGIYRSMERVDPAATWVMQGWMFLDRPHFWQPTQMKALFSAVPEDKLVVLDLDTEMHPVWNRTEAFYGEQWIWCMLHNFGGRISLYGDMEVIAREPAAALHSPHAGKLRGIGLTMEAIEQNPAIYALMLENVWRTTPIDLDAWLRDYAHRRYGQVNADAEAAWQVLKKTVYSHQPWWGTASIITGRPTFAPEAVWTYTHIPYDRQAFLQACDLLVRAAPVLKGSDGFRYDLVDVVRQSLANYANVLQQQFARAYEAKELPRYRRLTAEFLTLIDDIDRLLATRSDFLLGRWINSARRLGTNAAEKDLYEFNARDLITLWSGKDCTIHEYACKEWSGLLRGFYKQRWIRFFAYVDACLEAGKPVDAETFDRDCADWEWQWVNSHERYSDKPKGDEVKTAVAMYKKYEERMKEK
jgi:alpha-N-acetylglucosaminidase